jgi:hypothetical protein
VHPVPFLDDHHSDAPTVPLLPINAPLLCPEKIVQIDTTAPRQFWILDFGFWIGGYELVVSVGLLPHLLIHYGSP